MISSTHKGDDNNTAMGKFSWVKQATVVVAGLQRWRWMVSNRDSRLQAFRWQTLILHWQIQSSQRPKDADTDSQTPPLLLQPTSYWFQNRNSLLYCIISVCYSCIFHWMCPKALNLNHKLTIITMNRVLYHQKKHID